MAAEVYLCWKHAPAIMRYLLSALVAPLAVEALDPDLGIRCTQCGKRAHISVSRVSGNKDLTGDPR